MSFLAFFFFPLFLILPNTNVYLEYLFPLGHSDPVHSLAHCYTKGASCFLELGKKGARRPGLAGFIF